MLKPASLATLIVCGSAPLASAQTTFLYDGSLGGGTQTPGDQKFSYQPQPAGASPAPTAAAGVTTLDTRGAAGDPTDVKAGFFTHDPLLGLGVASGLPTLDPAPGFTLRFDLAVIDESHDSPDRAGFSVIVVTGGAGGAGTPAIELGFWEDRVFAYSFDPATDTFTQGENAPRAPAAMAAMTTYDLLIQGSTYSLLADGAPLLTGALRDYTGYDGPPDPIFGIFDVDPYDKPNLVFFGDDTTSASADVRLGDIAVVIPEPATSAMLLLTVLGVARGRRRTRAARA